MIKVEIENAIFTDFDLQGASNIISNVKSSNIRVDFYQSRTPINSVRITFTKLDNIIKNFLYSDSFFGINRPVTLTTNVNEPNERIFKGVIKRVTENYTNIIVEAVQNISNLKGNAVFGNSAQLANNITNSSTIINLKNIARPITQTELLLKVGAEVFSVQRVDENTFTILLRARLGTLAIDHATNEEVFVVDSYSGHPIDVLENILADFNLETNATSLVEML